MFGLTATTYGATASMIPLQKRAQASACWPRLVRASPRSSTGSSSGRGSSPTTSWLRLRSTASTRRSANVTTSVAARVSSSCAIGTQCNATGRSLLRVRLGRLLCGHREGMPATQREEILRRAELARRELHMLEGDGLSAQGTQRLSWIIHDLDVIV